MKAVCKKHGLQEHYTRSDHNGLKCKVCNAEGVTRHRRRKKLWCLAYLGGKCIDCGYNKCSAALEFHHRDPSKKEFQFAKYQKTSYKRLQKELDKCDLLCANCHRERHSEL